MAKSTAFERARLRKKYEFRGKNYSALASKIIVEQSAAIADAVLTTDKKRFDRNLKALAPKGPTGKKVVLPDVSNVIRRSPTIIKAAEKGKLLTQTLREKIRSDVKNTLLEEGISTTRGTVPKNLTKKLEKQLTETFKEYTKSNPKYGMPSNVHTIAVTEARTVANQIRLEYTREVAKQTPDHQVKKTWIQNRGLSREPRDSHARVDGQERDIDKPFRLKGKDGNLYSPNGPHDAMLPASETIGCNCELSFRFSLRKRKTPIGQ
jgi:hypothetical protein